MTNILFENRKRIVIEILEHLPRVHVYLGLAWQGKVHLSPLFFKEEQLKAL